MGKIFTSVRYYLYVNLRNCIDCMPFYRSSTQKSVDRRKR